MSLQPPLLVPSGDAENGERMIECISYHLKRRARPSAQFCRDIHRAANTIPVPNCCVIPCIDEVILDLERLVSLRDEIVYRFAETGTNHDEQEEPDADVIALLREYCALLGALTTVPGLGFSTYTDAADSTGERARDVQINGLFLTWHKLLEENDIHSADDDDAMKIDDIEEQHFVVSSLYAERQLSAYLLASLEYQSAMTKFSVSSSPDNPSRDLAHMDQARDALKSAQLGFGRAAALFDHVRTIVEHDMLEKKHEQQEADGSSSMHVDNETKISSTCTGSEYAEASSSVPMLPVSPHQLLDPSALHVLHLASMASGQACYYYHASVQKNRVQSALAKLSAGAAVMFEALASFARQMTEDETIANDTNSTVRSIRSHMPSKALLRSTYAAGENYYWALSEYHEACVKKSRCESGDVRARLRSSNIFIDHAKTEMLENHKHDLIMTANGLVAIQDTAEAHLMIRLQSLLCAKVITLNTLVSKLLIKAEEEWADDVDVPIVPLRPQKVMKLAPIPPEANFLEPALGVVALETSPPLQRLLNRAGVEACTKFHLQLAQMLISTRKTAHNATESAEEQLAKLGLPECITTFKATVEAAKTARRRNICGIPPAMTKQLESLHSSQGVMLLKHNLYNLEEVAALARQTLNKTEEMLDDAVQADNEFCRDHPTFTGRDVEVEHSQIAVTSLDGNGATETDARKTCAKIRGWLNQANEGDQKILSVLEEIETDPKYRLVMLPTLELEKLIRGGSGGLSGDAKDDEDDRTSSSSSTGTDGVDLGALVQQLEHLKTLMASRERILEEMEKDVLVFNQRERAVKAIARRGDISPDERLYQALTDVALPLFDHHFDKIKTSIDKQVRLFKLIVQLYTKFQVDKSEYEQKKEVAGGDPMFDAASSPAKSYLQKIASALKTISWIQPQLVQGRNFYQTVLTNIEELKKKVEDTNALLASERIFYEDSHHSRQEEEHRRRQEREDERLAQELMREAEEAAAQQPPQTPADPRQQEEDERLARELARQFQDEANISNNNGTNGTNLADNRDESMGEPADFDQGRNNLSLNTRVNDIDLTEGADRRGRNRNGRHRRSSSFDRVNDNARFVPPLEAPRRHSSLVDLGDIPREIFAPISPSGRSSGSYGRMTQISLGGVSSIASGSIVRSFHRQQQQQREEEIPPGDQEREVDIRGDRPGDNLAGIPIGPSEPDNRAEQQAVVPEPPSPLRGARRSTHTSGGITRFGLPGRSARPGIVNVQNDDVPEFEVNDEAFAQLVAMDFPPDMVRDALTRFDNVERATEYILSNL